MLSGARLMLDILTRIANRAKRIALAPRPTIGRKPDTIRLGSDYGGWILVNSPELHNCTVVSAGLGEDATFDIEFARKYNARVVIVDPTPCAIAHFEGIVARLGQSAQRGYSADGCQPLAAYELEGIVEGQLQLVRKALWIEPMTVKFFAPKNPAHVSHSIVNYQNEYSAGTDHIVVPATTLGSVLAEFQVNHLPLLKLDIEGAEHAVIKDMLEKNIRPSQLLVEFDELNFPSRHATAAFKVTDKLLHEAEYSIAHFDGRANFLYVAAETCGSA